MKFEENFFVLQFSFLLLISAIFIHALYGFILGLSVDEAHYFLYGLYLDYSYFDHPPMVGWLNALPVKLNWAVGFIRFIPQLLWIVSIFLNLYLTKLIIKLFLPDAEDYVVKTAPFWVVLIILSSPLIHVLSLGLLPDSILMVLVPLIFILTLKIHFELTKNHPQDMLLWIFLGIVLGCSALTKYTAILFTFGIFICLISWHHFLIFKRVGLWFCLSIAFIMLTPIFYWNYLHDWISFKYQFNHGVEGDWKIQRLGLFILIQIGCYGFVLLYGLISLLTGSIKLPKSLFSFSLLPLFVFFCLSGNGKSLPHWTVPAWNACTPLIAITLSNTWFLGRKWLIIILFSFQFTVIALAFSFLYFGGIPSTHIKETLKQSNPIADLFGWDLIGHKINQLSLKYHTQNLAVQNWTMGSRLAWYTKSKHVYILDDRNAQFDLWFGKLSAGMDVLLIQWSQMPYDLPVKDNQFSRCEKISTQKITRLGYYISEFNIFRCINWKGYY